MLLCLSGQSRSPSSRRWMTKFTEEEYAVAAAAVTRARVQQVLDELILKEVQGVNGAEVIFEEEPEEEEEEIQLHELDPAPPKMEDSKAEVMDPLAEVNLGTPQDPRIVYVSELLEESLKEKIIKVL